MFFEIGPVEKDELFSYVIVKHPDNIFEREIAPGRKVVGYFDDQKHNFKGYVENDPLKFLKTARELNLSHYVHTQLSGICPHNILGLDETFRTAIRGNFKKYEGYEEIYDHSFKKNHWKAFLGSYPCKLEIIQEWFDIVGINAEPYIQEDDNPGIDDYEFIVYNIKFNTKYEMTITEFLQKIYLISYYLTIKKEMTRINDDKIAKFVTYCSDWIEKIEAGPKRNRLINKLCGYNKNNIKKFEHLLIDKTEEDDEEKELRKNLVEDFINRKGLHRKRHELIKDIIIETNNNENNNLIELGSGSNQFLRYVDKKVKNFNMIGIEINSVRANRSSLRSKKNKINIKNSSILQPNIRFNDLNPDYLICTEVLEHLNEGERKQLLFLIKNFYNPDKIIITVPNFDYNKFIPGLCDEEGNYNGEYRHPDHKIEYTKDLLQSDIISLLDDKYKLFEYNLLDEDFEEQPSFVLYFQKYRHDDNKSIDKQYKIYNNIIKHYNPVHLPISNYEIREKELEKGYSSHAFNKNVDDIFYLGHTMAPTDSAFKQDPNNEANYYIEHPWTAIEYYRKRGIEELYFEEKYMGSRAYILIFKNIDLANKAGFESDIIVNSRGGFPFFKSNEDLNKIDWENLRKNMKTDFVALDCEIMPWNYKASNLIDFDFLVPGQCTYLSRKYGNYGNLTYVEEYLKTLNSYISNNEDDFEIRIFNILATGNLHFNNRSGLFERFTKVNLGMVKEREWHYNQIESLCKGCKILKPVVYYKYNQYDESINNFILNKWKEFTEKFNGEGFVVKPKYSIMYTDDGYMFQPAIKIRGSKYLQLIYGIDYIDKEYFEMVKKRKIVTKRKLAILQHELGINILRAWLKGDKFNKNKYIASFLGSEEAKVKGIDATL